MSQKSIGLAKQVRLHALDMTNRGNSSHIGSVFSMADILAVLYAEIMDYRANSPDWPDRDRFILSKGHAGAGVYAVLAESGFFSTNLLSSHYSNGSVLSGHVSHKGVPGVEFSTGSLGHGLPVATGMALAAQKKKASYQVFVLMGDGESAEGSNWESMLFAAHHKLSNLTALVDYNKLQSIRSPEETLGLEPFADKWRSFGWEVVEVDGHDHEQLVSVLSDQSNTDSPRCILCHTVKGKGVSFMENNILWHYRSAQDHEYVSARQELEKL